MRMYLYCTKTNEYLASTNEGIILSFAPLGEHYKNIKYFNGKFCAICDFETEELLNNPKWKDVEFRKKVYNDTCKDGKEIHNYLGNKTGYIIYVSNIEIFEEPMKPNVVGFATYPSNNLQYCSDTNVGVKIRSDELFRLLRGEQKAIIRKKILRGMMKYERPRF